MSALELLKKQSSISNVLQQVAKQQEKSNTKSFVDDRYWKITRDQSGNGSAVIRFLPAPQGESSPWAHMHTYKFRYPEKTGKYYWENSLYTIGQIDPCYSAWTRLKDSSDPEDKLRAKAIQRAEVFTSNILVISDPANPENNGKVFLFEYGKQIHNMIMGKLTPEFEDEPVLNVFDPFGGANFKLRTNIGETKLPTYIKSVFDAPSAISDDDDEIVAIWNKCHSLAELVAPDKFETYEKLEAKLNTVLYPGSKPAPVAQSAPVARTVVQEVDDLPTFPSPQPTPVAPRIATTTVDDDDDTSFFEMLANQD